MNDNQWPIDQEVATTFGEQRNYKQHPCDDGEIDDQKILTPSPRQRIKKIAPMRSEFPDSGPEMAKLRIASLIGDLLSDRQDRAVLERELDWLERIHPTSVVHGMLGIMASDHLSRARLSSICLKNFVSRLGRWQAVQEDVRKQSITLLWEELKQPIPRSSNAARVVAAICEAEPQASQTQITYALCLDAVQGIRGTCECLAFLGAPTLKLYKRDVLTALCQGLFTVSSVTEADEIVLRALCDVILCEDDDSDAEATAASSRASPSCPSTLLPLELVRAAVAFGARHAQSGELRARSVECFARSWQQGHGTDAAILPRTALEILQTEADSMVVERALDFWMLVSKCSLVSSYLESVLNAIISLITRTQQFQQPLMSDEMTQSIRELLSSIVSISPDCADVLAFTFESSIESDGGTFSKERNLALLALGSLCHSSWFTKEDGAKHSKLLTSSPFQEGPAGWIRPTARWALEQACLHSCDIFFSNPNDFGRLITTLVRMLSGRRTFHAPSANPAQQDDLRLRQAQASRDKKHMEVFLFEEEDAFMQTEPLDHQAEAEQQHQQHRQQRDVDGFDEHQDQDIEMEPHIQAENAGEEDDDPKEIIACACRCLVGMLMHDKDLAGGRLASPYIYRDELGRVPAQAPKTNRFSAYFSQLIEALSVCESEEANQAIVLLVDNCANDVLGFVAWMLNRQVRTLWSVLTLSASTLSSTIPAGSTTTGNALGGAAASAANKMASLSALHANRKRLWCEDSPYTSLPSLAHSDGFVPQRQKASSRSIPFTCARIQVCFERLSRAERDDPTLWKIAGEAGSVLQRILTSNAVASASLVSSDQRVHIMHCLRTICKSRGDVDLSSIIAEELADGELREDDERVCAALGLCFTRQIMEDTSVIPMLKEKAFKLELSVKVRSASLRALGEVVAERQRRGSCSDACSGQMCSAVWRCCNFNEEEELDTIWELLDASASCFLDYVNATLGTPCSSSTAAAAATQHPMATLHRGSSGGISTTPTTAVSEVAAKYVSAFIAQRAARACSSLPFHEKKISVALKCLSLVAGMGQVLRGNLLGPLFEDRYEEFGPVFDTVAEAVSGKEASGEAAQRAGKIASDALLLVFPKGSFE